MFCGKFQIDSTNARIKVAATCGTMAFPYPAMRFFRACCVELTSSDTPSAPLSTTPAGIPSASGSMPGSMRRAFPSAPTMTRQSSQAFPGKAPPVSAVDRAESAVIRPDSFRYDSFRQSPSSRARSESTSRTAPPDLGEPDMACHPRCNTAGCWRPMPSMLLG